MVKNVTTGTVQNVFRIVLGSFMILAAVGHLTFQRLEFQAQVPDWVPMSKDLVVILSGIVELALGIWMIFLPKFKVYAGVTLAIFYVLVFPGNIAQYVNDTSAFGLDTEKKRFVRLLFQPVLIYWALWCTGAIRAWRTSRTQRELHV